MSGDIYGSFRINRMEENTKEQVAGKRAGFKSGRACVDQLFI